MLQQEDIRDESYDVHVECDHCGELHWCMRDCDPLMEEVYDERTEDSYWCRDCWQERRDDI
jgi:hypothetical protein